LAASAADFVSAEVEPTWSAQRTGVTKKFNTLLELPEAGEEKSDRQFVTALARGLEVLRAFQPQDGPLGNQEIAERTGLPKPSISRMTHTLTTLGYLEYVPRLRKYRIGLGVLALGHACIGGAALRRAARPYMQKLAEYADATAALGGRDRLNMVYLDVYRGAHTAAFSLDAGARIPIHKTAMGYAYLWGIPEKERKLLLQAIRKRTGAEWRSINKRLGAAFISLERTGFCVAEGTYERGMIGVGAALVLQGGTEVHAFSASAPAFQFTGKRIKADIGPRLVALVNALEAELHRQTRRF
jgi:DNA-binding IclR family transcriptional regulator